MKGRFLLHFSDPANWRLRNLKEHPLDPGWEVGTYSVCHCKIRPLMNVGSVIFDVVVNNKKAILRSAFIVSNTQDITDENDQCYPRILYFDEFYFADREPPITLPGEFIQYRCMKTDTWMNKYGQYSFWDNVKKEYTKYRKGDAPKSVKPDNWNYMVEEASKIRISKRYSQSCGEKQIKGKCE